jgi:hypothetical protein
MKLSGLSSESVDKKIFNKLLNILRIIDSKEFLNAIK